MNPTDTSLESPLETPSLPETSAPPPLPKRSGWWMHLALLLGFPILLAVVSEMSGAERNGPVLDANVGNLLQIVAFELGIFAVVFLSARNFSKAGADQLLLPWRDGLWPWLRGAGYSIGLRIFVGLIVFMCVAIYAAFNKVDEASVRALQPKVEVLIDMKALVNDPVYLFLNLTLVSFVMAGLREELWRAGMLAALRNLWPQHFGTLKGGIAASALIAIAFGLGHFPQGPGAVGMTAVLGFGLGVIMVYHKSIWDAVLAHGFFDATTFAGLYLVLKFKPELLGGG